jgi:hypothetical protein
MHKKKSNQPDGLAAAQHILACERCLDLMAFAFEEHDREQLCGPRNVPNQTAAPAAAAASEARSHSAGAASWSRACGRGVSRAGRLALPSFAYASSRDPLDARRLEAIAIGVTPCKYRRARDPLPVGDARAGGVEDQRVTPRRRPAERPPHGLACPAARRRRLTRPGGSGDAGWRPMLPPGETDATTR